MIRLIFLGLFISFSFSLASFAEEKTLRVLIDPGHGGTDTGAVYGKAREADIVLKVSKHLRDYLNSDPNFNSSLTREKDTDVSLQERVRISESQKADLVLSLHANAAPDKRARGVEFYFQNHLAPDEEALYIAATENQIMKQSQKLSESNDSLEPTKKNDILSIIEDLKRQHRMRCSLNLSKKLLQAWELSSKSTANVIRQAPFYIVSKTQVPSVLVELGFLTNPNEASRLMDSEYQKKIAYKIYLGLLQYKENITASNNLTISLAQ